MSFNMSNFYNNYFPPCFPHQNTFQQPEFVPPPPPPPPPLPQFFMSPISSQIDQDMVKVYDNLPHKPLKHKPEKVSINALKEKLRNIVLTLNSLKEKETYFKDHTTSISETEWDSLLVEIKIHKDQINSTMTNLTDSYLDSLRKALAKRTAKRLRQKRQRRERKKEKENRIKEMEEKSRKIDENLQKIKDDILKAKQEEEAKLEADIVLKEVLRKKQDGKKCLTKLDALVRLYKARQNTARGRGEDVNERDATSYNNNIEKLKSLWSQKLLQYEKEESELRATLKRHDEDPNDSQKKEAQVLDNLAKWREFLFGAPSSTPQFNFKGNIGNFVAVRSHWDQYINPEGSSLPVGWVFPNINRE